MTAFERIYEVVRQVPRGSVTTYGMVARLAGNARWARAVGYALHANPDPYYENDAEFRGAGATAAGRSVQPKVGRVHTKSTNTEQAGGIPCHRVLNRFGEVCEGFVFGGAEIQRGMLEAEGVQFSADGRVDLKEFGWLM